MIDVVFLLIIFFMLICQYIVRENYKLVIPDDCPAALVPDHLDRNAITVSVVPRPDTSQTNPDVLYAVRTKEFDPRQQNYDQQPEQLIDDMARQIATEAQRKQNALIYLRADKNLSYGDVQKALLALSQARIQKVQLAAFRSTQNNNNEPGEIEK
jgi:biopolymer transport protein ExbD